MKRGTIEAHGMQVDVDTLVCFFLSCSFVACAASFIHSFVRSDTCLSVIIARACFVVLLCVRTMLHCSCLFVVFCVALCCY